MLVKMLAEHRELQINHRYELPEPRAEALVAAGFAVALERPVVEADPIEKAVAAPAPEKAVKPRRRRKK